MKYIVLYWHVLHLYLLPLVDLLNLFFISLFQLRIQACIDINVSKANANVHTI